MRPNFPHHSVRSRSCSWDFYGLFTKIILLNCNQGHTYRMSAAATKSIQFVEESKVGEVPSSYLNVPAPKSLDAVAGQRARSSGTRPKLSRDVLLNLVEDSIESTMEAKSRAAEPKKTRQHQQRQKGVSDSGVPSPPKPKKWKSAEEIFYATMNGDALGGDGDLSLATSPYADLTGAENDPSFSAADDSGEFLDYGDNGEPDANSFAGFDLLKEARMGELLKQEDAVVAAKMRNSSRKTDGQRLRNSSHTKTGSDPSSTADTVTASSGSSIPSGQDDLSVADIKAFVMDKLPDEVKKMLPADVWDKIFQEQKQKLDEQSVVTTKSTKEALKNLISRKSLSQSDILLDVEPEDDASAVSELTSITIADKKEEKLRRPLEKELGISSREDQEASDNKRFAYTSASVAEPSKKSPVPPKVTRFQDEPDVRRCKDSSAILKVTFDSVSVRFYERILDINPSVTNGPPIGIGWRYRRGPSVSVDQWEIRKNGYSAAEGPAKNFLLPRAAREKMLYDLGYTQKDIAQAVRTVRKDKDQRRTTVDNLNVQSMEEAVENATDLMKNMLRVGRKRGLVRY